MAEQFQAVLECTADPCTYCRHRGDEDTPPPRRWAVAHPDGPFPTEAAAGAHGRGMALNVYGSEHRVVVQRREVTPWADL